MEPKPPSTPGQPTRSDPRRARAALPVIAVVGAIVVVAGLLQQRSASRGLGPQLAPGDSPTERLAILALQSPPRAAVDDWRRAVAAHRSSLNVVMVSLESVGMRRVGFGGYERDVTPRLDRIAEDSMVFERAYATATHSNYAQMAILSSLFPRRGSTLDMYGRIDYERAHMHDVAHALGMQAATISSQDESWQGMLRYQSTDTPTFLWHSPDFTGKHLNLISDEAVPDNVTIDKAILFIDATDGAPFSLYVNLQSTHFPYPLPDEAPRPYLPEEPRGNFDFLHWDPADRQAIENRYDNALSYVDSQVGRLFDALDDRSLLANTLFVVSADHGELFFEHGLVTHGRSLFDGEALVPLMIHEPVARYTRVGSAVSTLDVVPTIVDLLGLPPHPVHQGVSVRFAGLPDEPKHPAIFLNIQGWVHADAVVCPPYKLISDPESGQAALFDFELDPGEMHDLSASQPQVRDGLATTLAAQIEAQQRYHADTEEGRALRESQLAPLILPCPELPPRAPVVPIEH